MPLLHPSRVVLTNRLSVLIGVLTALTITAFLIILMLVLYRNSKQWPAPVALPPREYPADVQQPTLPPAYTYLQPSSASAHSKAYRAPSPGTAKGATYAAASAATAPSRPSISSYTSRSRFWSPSGSIVAYGPGRTKVPAPPRTQESLATLPSTWSSSTLAAPVPSAPRLSQEQASLIRSQRSSFVGTSESGTTTLVQPYVQRSLWQRQHNNLQPISQAQATNPYSPTVATSTRNHNCRDPTSSLHPTRPRSTSLPTRIDVDSPCALRHIPPPSSTSNLTTVGESTIVEQQEWRVTTSTKMEKGAEGGAEGEAEGEGEASVDSFVAVMLKRCSTRRDENQSIEKVAEMEMQGYKDGIVDANERLAAVFEALGLGKVDITVSRPHDAVQALA